jgi:hypothetical protein
MFSEILKIIPKIEAADVDKMTNILNTRFKKIAKNFGSGLKTVLMGGGIAGIGLALIDKILNPLKETQEAIDKILGRADNLKDMAEEFGTTTGNLFKLQALAKARGVDPEQLNTVIGKFQSAVAEAIADPSKATSVRNYAVPGQDTAEAFFKFIQNMQNLAPEQRTLVQNEIFGEKMRFKLADFFNEKDFVGLSNRLGLAGGASYTSRIDAGSEVANKADELRARNDAFAFNRGVGRISEGMVTANSQLELQKMIAEQDKFAKFNSMVELDKTINKLTNLLSDIVGRLGKELTKSGALQAIVKEIVGAKVMRGVNPFGKEE